MFRRNGEEEENGGWTTSIEECPSPHFSNFPLSPEQYYVPEQ
jgi:hypothetical protein